jgi:hypothetical protein
MSERIDDELGDEAERIAKRRKEVREWLTRLRACHAGGYHLADVSVDTIIRNATFLQDLADGKPPQV